MSTTASPWLSMWAARALPGCRSGSMTSRAIGRPAARYCFTRAARSAASLLIGAAKPVRWTGRPSFVTRAITSRVSPVTLWLCSGVRSTEPSKSRGGAEDPEERQEPEARQGGRRRRGGRGRDHEGQRREGRGHEQQPHVPAGGAPHLDVGQGADQVVVEPHDARQGAEVEGVGRE